MLNPTLIIFDWDGTLMDSTGRIVDCMQRAAADLQLPPLSSEAAQGIIGLGLPQAIRTLFPGLGEADVARMRDAYAQHFIAAEAEPNCLFPGIERMLDQLANDNVLLAVATGKSRKGLERVWGNTGYARWFCASRCADETESKPHPAMVHELLQELAVPAEESVVVGDTSFDLEMARRGDVRGIGVTWGAHAPDRLLSQSPHALVDHVHELMSLLSDANKEIA